ncbi:hypothetical protein ACWGI9_43675 [Streptomyces sp. NPDC054833]
MTERLVIVSAPDERGGREICADGKRLGTAYGLRDLAVFLQGAGWPGVDELDVAESPFVEWHGGGPEVWRPE